MYVYMGDSYEFQAFLNQEFESLIASRYTSNSDSKFNTAVDDLVKILLDHLRNPQEEDLQRSFDAYYTQIGLEDIIDADLMKQGHEIIERSRSSYDNAKSKLKELFSQPISIIAATAAAAAAVAASLSTPAVMASAAISSAAFSAIRAHYTPTSGTSDSDSEVRQLLMYAILQYSFDRAKLHYSADSYRGGAAADPGSPQAEDAGAAGSAPAGASAGDDKEQKRRQKISRYNRSPGAPGSAPAGGGGGGAYPGGAAADPGSPQAEAEPDGPCERISRCLGGRGYRSKKKQKSRRHSYRKRNRTRKKRTRQTRARKKRTRGKTYS
tara:strand:+ start:4345 stop:5316 length:972 start_codon:yes stop_codon:yes gene_type:complete